MIVETALTLTLSLPAPVPHVTPVEFSDPVRRVITYPSQAVLNQISGLAMPDGTREAYENEFLAGSGFFGAFAVTKDFSYGYVTGANSLEAARDIAVAECLKHADKCFIYAEMMPQGYEPLPNGAVSMAAEAADYYTNPDPSWNSHRAMAISEDGAYSIVWGHGSVQAAEDAALADCTSYLIADLPGLRPMPCVVVPFK